MNILRRARAWALVFGGLWSAVAAAATGLPPQYVAETLESALGAAHGTGKPVLLYFTQDHCSYCAKLGQLLTLPNIADTFSRGYHFVLVDISRGRHEPEDDALRTRYKVPVAPTLVFLDGEGRHVCTAFGGFRDEADALRLNRHVRARIENGAVAPAGRLAGPCETIDAAS